MTYFVLLLFSKSTKIIFAENISSETVALLNRQRMLDQTPMCDPQFEVNYKSSELAPGYDELHYQNLSAPPVNKQQHKEADKHKRTPYPSQPMTPLQTSQQRLSNYQSMQGVADLYQTIPSRANGRSERAPNQARPCDQASQKVVGDQPLSHVADKTSVVHGAAEPSKCDYVGM